MILLFNISYLPILGALPEADVPTVDITVEVTRVTPVVVTLHLRHFQTSYNTAFAVTNLTVFSFYYTNYPDVTQHDSSTL